ncbi:hypothetical protein V5H41_20910, partial [Salmonella enterica]
VGAPRENKKYRYYTRRDELTLAPDEVGTLISQRYSRCEIITPLARREKTKSIVITRAGMN